MDGAVPFHTLATVLAAVSACLTGPVALAAEVSSRGGFTSFRGPVATATGDDAASVHTELNGVTVYADEPSPGAQYGHDTFGLGLKNTSGLLDGGGNPSCRSARRSASAPSASPTGSWFGNSPDENIFPDTDFGFSVTTHSSDPRLDGFTSSDTLRFVVTSRADSDATVQQDADYRYFVGYPELGTLSV